MHIFFKKKDILSYLRKHSDVSLLFRFNKEWAADGNVLQVDTDCDFKGMRMVLCGLHNNELIYIIGRAKTFAMDVYFYFKKICHEHLECSAWFENMLKTIPEMRASIDVPLTQNIELEQELQYSHIFAYGNTIVMEAARYNYIGVLNACLQAGANPNVRRRLPSKEARELAFPTPGSSLEKALSRIHDDDSRSYHHVLCYQGNHYDLRVSIVKEDRMIFVNEGGQYVNMPWENISKNDYVVVGNAFRISGYAMISYFKYGVNASFYASMDIALGLALSFNQPDCVRALLKNGANPHLHIPETGSVLTPVFVKGHQEALDAFMQAFDRFADVKPMIEMMLDKFPIYRGANDACMDSDTKILDALVASRQYRYFCKFLSQMPNDHSFLYVRTHYPRFLRAAVCYPGLSELERMQANTSNIGEGVMTQCQLYAVDVERAFALNMPGLLEQLPQYPNLVLRYLYMSKPHSKEDIDILSIFFTSVLANPMRHHAACVYYDGFSKALQIQPKPLVLASGTIDYWKQLVGASAFSRFMQWARIERQVAPEAMKPSGASHAGSLPADECVQAIRSMWQAQKPEAIHCPSMHLATSEDALPSSVDVFSMLDAPEGSRITPQGRHGVAWSLMIKQVQKLQRCKSRVELMITRIDQRIASKLLDDIEKDITWCVKMHAYVGQRVQELTSRCKEIIDAIQSASQAAKMHEKSVKHANSNDAKMDEKKQASALKITGMFTKRCQVRDTLGVKKTRAMQFFHTIRHPVASDEESRLKGFVLDVARAAWPWAHAEFDDVNERDAAQLCALVQWSIAMWQLHTVHKNTQEDLSLPCIALIRHYLVHHSYALDSEEVMASLLALELFDQRCVENPAIDWRVALWSVYHPLLRSARQRFSQYLPESSRNMYFLSNVLLEAPASPETQHETFSQSLGRIEHVLIRYTCETEEVGSEQSFLHWLHANDACVRLLLLACLQLVESSNYTHHTLSRVNAHCLKSLGFELRHGVRNPFAHHQIEVEKTDANQIVAYRLREAPVEMLANRLSVFSGLVHAWTQMGAKVARCV